MRNQSRNINPHKPASLAMFLWPHEYAHEFGGGAMDFWDSLDERRKRYCRDAVAAVEKAPCEKEVA